MPKKTSVIDQLVAAEDLKCPLCGVSLITYSTADYGRTIVTTRVCYVCDIEIDYSKTTPFDARGSGLEYLNMIIRKNKVL